MFSSRYPSIHSLHIKSGADSVQSPFSLLHWHPPLNPSDQASISTPWAAIIKVTCDVSVAKLVESCPALICCDLTVASDILSSHLLKLLRAHKTSCLYFSSKSFLDFSFDQSVSVASPMDMP